ncbi:MAG: hypothetical protein AB2696_21680, partial [Candidatus Thiodiazotropha sp.]
ADHIYIEELHNHNLYDEVSQAFTVFLPVKSVGADTFGLQTLRNHSGSAPALPRAQSCRLRGCTDLRPGRQSVRGKARRS